MHLDGYGTCRDKVRAQSRSFNGELESTTVTQDQAGGASDQVSQCFCLPYVPLLIAQRQHDKYRCNKPSRGPGQSGRGSQLPRNGSRGPSRLPFFYDAFLIDPDIHALALLSSLPSTPMLPRNHHLSEQ